MYAKNFPVYNIEQFYYPRKESDFYISVVSEHLKKFRYVLYPHKHDHFLTILCTHGGGTHDVDFVSYPIKRGSIFMLSPGQTHSLNISPDMEGYVLLHTQDFYDVNYSNKRVRDYPFFCSNLNSPQIVLQEKDLSRIVGVFNELLAENKNENLLKNQILCSLVDMLYVYLTRLYLPKKKVDNRNQTYLVQLLRLEDAIDLHFKDEKSPGAYASMLGMSIKHLNLICNICLGKTTTEIILNRVMLEAKRMLSQGMFSVEKVAIELGYLDTSYFTRLFKKTVGVTPLLFMKRYHSHKH